MSMIEVQGLAKRYGDLVALGGVDFQIEKGEVVGLLGPNGAGKSTTMKILTGFISPSSGSARVCGVDVLEDPVEARRKLGYLPEAAPVYPDMRVEDYLDFVGQVRGLARSELAAAKQKALQRTGLLDRRQQVVGTLSKGYKQRVGLAQAILHDPDILILDEPTSGLDPNQIVDIRELIRELGRSKTVVLSTHILPEVQASCDRVLIINEGLIVADGPTDEVTATQAGEVVHLTVIPGAVKLSAEAVVATFQAVPGVASVSRATGSPQFDDELKLVVRADEELRPQLFQAASRAGLVLVELRQERSNLEDVFRALTTG